MADTILARKLPRASMRLCDKDVHSGHIFHFQEHGSHHQDDPGFPMSTLVAEADGFFPAARRWHKITLHRGDCWIVTIDYLTRVVGDTQRTFQESIAIDDDDEDHDDDDKALVRFFKDHAKMIEDQRCTYVRGLRPIGDDTKSWEARDDALKEIANSYRAVFGRLLAEACLLGDHLFDKTLALNPTLALAAQHRNVNVADDAFRSLSLFLRQQAPEQFDGPPPPVEASDLQPGSASKLDLMEWRASGEELSERLRGLFGQKSHPLQVFHPDESPDEACARVVAALRNGRIKRVEVVTERFTSEDPEEAEFELERLVAIDEARFVRNATRAA